MKAGGKERKTTSSQDNSFQFIKHMYESKYQLFCSCSENKILMCPGCHFQSSGKAKEESSTLSQKIIHFPLKKKKQESGIVER